MTARSLVFCNQKGGVGKTTTAFYLARAAVIAGRRVLLVDLDPQGNVTSAATAEPVAEDQAGVADALSTRASETLRDVIVAGIWVGLSVAPTSGETLGYVRDELVIAGAGREGRLREAVADLAEDYELILIDCPPSLDQLTINGLTAAAGVVIVTQSKLWSTNGLAHLLTTIDNVRQYYNPTLTVAGVVVNQHEEHTVGGKHWRDELNHAAHTRELPVLDPPVPKRVVIADAVEAARGLDEWGTSDAKTLAEIYTTYLHALEGGPA